ncbi:MAG TPA: SIR2 family protein [Candidatus Lokiarchaeia archaeon]|nr:SIR2 family protein [Candidatus Lokiarchaeia archaeon]
MPISQAIISLQEAMGSISAFPGFVLFTGAGTSIPPPSCAPSWWTLTEEIIDAIFSRVPDDFNLPTDMIIKSPDRQPEVVFENFANILGDRLYTVFKALNVTKPNDVHNAVALLAKAGVLKACFTTNFDVFFERALAEVGVDYDLLVDNREYDDWIKQHPVIDDARFVLCKIHGTIDRPDTIVSVASAYKSAKGFSEPKGNVFSTIIRAYPILFLGYSGYDFNHANYRKFWERAGPSVKHIYWNRRTGDMDAPDFDDIFRTCSGVFTFASGDLPESLLEGITTASDGRLQLVPQEGATNADAEIAAAKESRVGFFKDWANGIPETHLVSIVMTEAATFSTRLNDFMKSYKESSSEKDAVHFNATEIFTRLAQQFQNQEITFEDYQKRTADAQYEMQMANVRSSYRPELIAILSENRYPGITDNQRIVSQFISFFGILGDKFPLDDTINLTVDIMNRYGEAFKHTQELEGRLDMAIISYEPTIRHPNEELFKPYYEQMLKLKQDCLDGLISERDVSDSISSIIQAATRERLGVTISHEKLRDILIDKLLTIDDPALFIDACGVLYQTLAIIGVYLISEIIKKPEYTALAFALNPEDGSAITPSIIGTLDAVVRKPFNSVIEKAASIDDVASRILDATLLNLWIVMVQYTDPRRMHEYAKEWDSGVYPSRCSPAKVCAFLQETYSMALEAALPKFSQALQHKICRDLTNFAEMSNDIALAERIASWSLSITDGTVTEATPTNIPGSLAGFYDRAGDAENALHYYDMSVAAIKLAIPPDWNDSVLYRAAVLHAEAGDPRKALELLGRFHPDFHGNATVVIMPARKHALDLAQKLAAELGYPDANTAIEAILS